MQSGINSYPSTGIMYISNSCSYGSRRKYIHDYVSFTCFNGNRGYTESGHFSDQYFDTLGLWSKVLGWRGLARRCAPLTEPIFASIEGLARSSPTLEVSLSIIRPPLVTGGP